MLFKCARLSHFLYCNFSTLISLKCLEGVSLFWNVNQKLTTDILFVTVHLYWVQKQLRNFLINDDLYLNVRTMMIQNTKNIKILFFPPLWTVIFKSWKVTIKENSASFCLSRGALKRPECGVLASKHKPCRPVFVTNTPEVKNMQLQINTCIKTFTCEIKNISKVKCT